MADHLDSRGASVLALARERPGGPELLELAADRDDVELVGGAARDLLLGRAPRELDVVLDGDAGEFARTLAVKLGAPRGAAPGGRSGVIVHERFGTALVCWAGVAVDIASRRAESYAAPGALPQVRPGTPEEDLARRDFTVNSIAVGLGGSRAGTLRAVADALADLAAGRLRVLHDRSFLDDPTRLLRLGRYRARLGFQPEERTASLAGEALAGGALATVSAGRVGTELRLALGEADPLAAMAGLEDVGVLRALHPSLHVDRRLAGAALALLPEDGRADLLLLATVLLSAAQTRDADGVAVISRLLESWQFTAAERDRAVRTASEGAALPARLQAAQTPSQIRQVVGSAPVEAIALAGAIGQERDLQSAVAGARSWLAQLRHVHLQITGADLLAAGVPAGPEIGERLERALVRKLDGELTDDREAEMSAAVEAL